jgi:hypothetical protein
LKVVPSPLVDNKASYKTEDCQAQGQRRRVSATQVIELINPARALIAGGWHR